MLYEVKRRVTITVEPGSHVFVSPQQAVAAAAYLEEVKVTDAAVPENTENTDAAVPENTKKTKTDEPRAPRARK